MFFRFHTKVKYMHRYILHICIYLENSQFFCFVFTKLSIRNGKYRLTIVLCIYTNGIRRIIHITLILFLSIFTLSFYFIYTCILAGIVHLFSDMADCYITLSVIIDFFRESSKIFVGRLVIEFSQYVACFRYQAFYQIVL